MNLYAYAPYIFLIVFLLIAFIVSFSISYNKRKEERLQRDFLKRLDEANGLFTDGASQNTVQDNYKEKWNKHWEIVLVKSKLITNEKMKKDIGKYVFYFSLAIYIIFTICFRNLGIGLMPIIFILSALTYLGNNRNKKQDELFDEQIPNFLAILKSNIQANETPENALINAINNTVDPLYSELKMTKALTETGTFINALTQLRLDTNNDTLKFLCSCIELSSKVGSNLENQIVIIEEMLEAKRALKRKLSIAISENRPLVYVSSIIIVFLFLFTYMINEQTRAYWFNSITSWIVFIIAIGIFSLGQFLANRLINKISDF